MHDSRHYEQKGAWRHVSTRYRSLLYVSGELRTFCALRISPVSVPSTSG